MANIHGAIAIGEKRVKTKWSALEQNRRDLERLCAEPDTKGPQDAQQVAQKQERLTQLLEENRTLLQEIEKQYLALFQIRHR